MKFVFSNDGIVFVSRDSDTVIIFSNDMGLVTVDHNNVSFDDVILKLLFMLDLWLGAIDICCARHVKM